MPEADIYHGHDGVRQFWRSWTGTWDDFDLHLQQALDAVGDDVVASIHQVGIGRGSGAGVEQRFARAG
jgi:hypothetical protein